ncbi:MAG: 3'(2'),5'-bisphosphate nucleotidase CysQ [Verrucomicrobiales bacterium]
MRAQAIDPKFLLESARLAGEAILEIYARDFSVVEKDDRSPLTEADRRSHEILCAALAERYPDLPILSEESKAAPYAERHGWPAFWLIDPLDGTKEFIKKNGEFTVNIALVEGGEPTLGVVLQPAAGIAYWGRRGEGAFRRDAAGERRIEGGAHYAALPKVRVVGSRSHLTPEVEAFTESLRAAGKEVEFRSAGSSLKLCLVAEGAADVYPRFGPTMEWDTAAAQAVAEAAGRKVLAHPGGDPLRYNKPDLLNPWFVVE